MQAGFCEKWSNLRNLKPRTHSSESHLQKSVLGNKFISTQYAEDTLGAFHLTASRVLLERAHLDKICNF